VQGGGAPLPAWLAGKGVVDGNSAAYVCARGTCSPPVTEWEALEPLLGLDADGV